MVKKTAQTLQAFGTELAETELPNDVQATSNLLTTHTEKKDKMKVRFKLWSDLSRVTPTVVDLLNRSSTLQAWFKLGCEANHINYRIFIKESVVDPASVIET